MATRNTETIVDDFGIKMTVEYEYKKEGGGIVAEKLIAVNVIICQAPGLLGRDINILPLLHPDEIETIISNLNYDNL